MEKGFSEVAQQQSGEVGLNSGPGDQYFTFLLADHEYGVDILRIQEIRGWNGVRKMPQLPTYIKGVIDLRGEVVPIIDLRERFGMRAVPYNGLTVVVVMRVVTNRGDQVMGVVVDAVSDVLNISAEECKAAPDMSGDVDVSYIQNIATVNDKMVVLLNIDDLLGNLPHQVAGQQVEEESAGHQNEINCDDITDDDLDVDLLEESFNALAPHGAELVAVFYSELFQRYPDVKPLFAETSIEDQERKLLGSLKLVVDNIRRSEKLASELGKLGQRHQAYGAVMAHYDAVAEVMLDTLKKFAGGLWTEKMHRTWLCALKKVNAAMLEGYETALPQEQVALLESSFEALAPQADPLVARFYARLFELHPEVKPMFADSDLGEQQKKLVSALTLVINNLRDPEALQNALKGLGSKHQAYGAEAAHFDAVAAVMLEVLEAFAGDLWTPPMATAWSDALGAIKAVMLEGYE